MSTWDAAVADYDAELVRRGPARPPSTLGEIWRANWASSGLDTFSGVGTGALIEQHYDELTDKAEAATGRRLRMGVAVPLEERVAAIRDGLATLDDEARKPFELLLDVRKRASDKAHEIEREANEVNAQAYGLSGIATMVLAGVARQAVDPLNLATLPLGGPLKGPLLRVIGREAAIGAVTQAVQEPAIQRGRAELGLESGLGRAATDIGEAAIGAGRLTALFRGAAAGMRYARGRPAEAPTPQPMSDWSGDLPFTGYLSPEDAAALDRGGVIAPAAALGAGAPGRGSFDIASGAQARPTRDRTPEQPPPPRGDTSLGYLSPEDAAALDRGGVIAPAAALGAGAPGRGSFDIASGAQARPTRDRTPEQPPPPRGDTSLGYLSPEDAAALDRGGVIAPAAALGAGAPGRGSFDIASGAQARPTRDRTPEQPPPPRGDTSLGYLSPEDAAALDRGGVIAPAAALGDASPGGFDFKMNRAFDVFSAEDMTAAARLAERDTLIDGEIKATGIKPEQVEQAAKAIEEGRPIDVPPSTGPLIGAAVETMPLHRVAAADGSAIQVMPVVVEAASLRTSADAGFDAGLQPRQRNRAASQQQIREIAARLDPERLGVSSEADRGAPIVGADRLVESGNGRVLALRQAYAENGAAAESYRAWLAGQGVDVSAFKEPVLVRQRMTDLAPEQRRAFTLAANQASTLALSATERALADARLVDADLLALLRNPVDLGAAANREFIRRFVAGLPQTEQGAIADARGAISSEGLTRIRNAVLARAYGDAPILARVAEATADDVKSISNGLVAAAPQWAALRAEIEGGHVRADVDLTAHLIEALTRTAELRANRVKLLEYLNQQDAFDQLPPTVEGFMRMFYNEAGTRAAGGERIGFFLQAYAQEARKASAEVGLDLGIAPASARDIQALAKKRTELEYGRDDKEKPDLFAGGGAGVRAGGAPDGGEVPGRAAGAAGDDAGAAGPGGDRAGQPGSAENKLGDQALAKEAERALAELGGDTQIIQPDGTAISARQALDDAQKRADAAAELRDCIGDTDT